MSSLTSSWKGGQQAILDRLLAPRQLTPNQRKKVPSRTKTLGKRRPVLLVSNRPMVPMDG